MKVSATEPDFVAFAWILIAMSAVLAVMPVRRVAFEVQQYGLVESAIPVLILFGTPLLGVALGRIAIRAQGRGNRLFGAALGLFFSALALMGLQAVWAYQVISNL
ncbi:hypothetical protein [Nonomuraea sp. NPDC046570]|uniref:hypothetical protein n=1 Tax=Nonomuraea sp. NPDC046570 TaxID=3155255 RepID=UPI0033D3380C